MELTIFENEKFGEIRTVEVEGTTWFVASDICNALDIKNPSDALKKLDSDERSRFNLGRQGETNVINEYGLYSFVLTSRKPQAKDFKRWITHEVIPSIRKTGSYSVKDNNFTENPAVLELEKYKAETERINANTREKEYNLSALIQRAKLLKELIPDAEGEYKTALGNKLFELLNDGPLESKKEEKPLYKANEIGIMLGISGNKVGRIANDNDLKISLYGEKIPYVHDGKIHYNFCYYKSVLPVIREILLKEKR